MEMNDETKVTANVPIVLSQDLKTKIDYLSTTFEPEVAGWLVGEVKADYIYLDDILIPKQEVSGGSVDINPSAGVELVKEFKDKCKNILGHWHSHCPNGHLFWSGTDETNISQIIEPRKFFIFIVSAGGKDLVRLESKKPFRISLDNMSYTILRPGFEDIKKKLDEEHKAKVTEKTYNNFNNYVRTSNTNLYKYSNKDKVVDLPDQGGFELEIADHVIAEFTNKRLAIRGLDESSATQVVSMYPSFKPESYGDFHNKVVTFKVKRKKARKMLAEIQDVIDANRSETLNGYGSGYGCGYDGY
jgi:hypothetical protein